jgi:hypothetical protein
MVELTDREILLRLTCFEDSLVERKVISDVGDCLKVAVAFANTPPISVPAILFVGVRNNGEIEESRTDLDKLQQTVSSKIANAYPPIYPFPRVLTKDGKQFLAILLFGSENRPHFAGQAYIRDGSRSIPASGTQFDMLIAERNGKTYEILAWKDKAVTLTQPLRERMLHGSTVWDQPAEREVTIVGCNQYYVILESISRKGQCISYPLRLIELNYDNARRRLELRLLEGSIPG